MADSSTAAPKPSDGGAAAGTTFQLEVSTLAGGRLATIPNSQGSWQLGDVLGRLPAVLPGHRYQLLKGEAVLAPRTAIAEWARPVEGRACITAVVLAPQTPEEQRQLDLALIWAAGALDVEKVRELLCAGADATARNMSRMTALFQAVDAIGPRKPGDGKDGERDEEEKVVRLQAVIGALLFARADVDARREDVDVGVTFITCALHSAVQLGSLGPVRMLLDAMASVDAGSQELHGSAAEVECESTALHMATQAGNLPLTALLLERGANVNAVRRHLEEEGETLVRVRETALHLAVAGGHQALVALLVQARAYASVPRLRDGRETSVEELCAGSPGMLATLKADTSATLLAGDACAAEVEAALAEAARSGVTPELGG